MSIELRFKKYFEEKKLENNNNNIRLNFHRERVIKTRFSGDRNI